MPQINEKIMLAQGLSKSKVGMNVSNQDVKATTPVDENTTPWRFQNE